MGILSSKCADPQECPTCPTPKECPTCPTPKECPTCPTHDYEKKVTECLKKNPINLACDAFEYKTHANQCLHSLESEKSHFVYKGTCDLFKKDLEKNDTRRFMFYTDDIQKLQQCLSDQNVDKVEYKFNQLGSNHGYVDMKGYQQPHLSEHETLVEKCQHLTTEYLLTGGGSSKVSLNPVHRPVGTVGVYG